MLRLLGGLEDLEILREMIILQFKIPSINQYNLSVKLVLLIKTTETKVLKQLEMLKGR